MPCRWLSRKPARYRWDTTAGEWALGVGGMGGLLVAQVDHLYVVGVRYCNKAYL